MGWKGSIISGEYDSQAEEFILQQVKHISTLSTLNSNQVNQLYHYLYNHKDEADGQVLTMNDQLLVPLSQTEINQLIEDLEQIRLMYK
ncbi:hypothetical protein [Halobacillus sp. BBL2006]|uniref:hypothetical protein n=1 Tax=Halobacillus sp. BBL2006 TaxID=1543706 RepID=UPI00054231FB|nr:hypothetical protein [Halobacillus sp. BBL2006]KHE72981.1 hypothetical protein LD39_01710 [Halobacillus sp. BBL2006]